MTDHAKANAAAWAETIVAAMTAMQMLDGGEESAAVDGETYDDADTLRERLQEMPLSVQVRGGWVNPGETAEAEEYAILLTTGGPALRVYGMLGSYGPETARLQYQDWGTPWTDLDCETNDHADPVLAFAGLFYFGE